MKKNMWGIGCLVLMGLSIVGCRQYTYFKTQNFQAEKNQIEEDQEVIPWSEGEPPIFSSEDFVPFFKQYFSFNDEEILKLHQISPQIDVAYWENLRKNYQPLIKKKLQAYLAPEVQKTLDRAYLQAQLNMPKWIKINEYAVSGHAVVDQVEIQSTRDLENETIYEIEVETRNACYPLEVFYQNYLWDKQIGYWRKRTEEEKEEVDKEIQASSYVYSKKQDRIKLKQLFWITVKKQEMLQVTKIEYVQGWEDEGVNQNHFLETQHIERIPYQNQIMPKDKARISKVMNAILKMNKDDRIYYEKCYETSLEAFKNVWKDRLLEKEVMLEASYKMAFPKTIVPYRDEINQLEINEEEMEYEPSVYSTQNQPRFIVTIPVKALLNNEQIVYYRYRYFVCLENNQIEAIQLLNVEDKKTDEHTVK